MSEILDIAAALSRLLKAENVCFILGKRAFSFLQKGAGGRVPNA